MLFSESNSAQMDSSLTNKKIYTNLIKDLNQKNYFHEIEDNLMSLTHVIKIIKSYLERLFFALMSSFLNNSGYFLTFNRTVLKYLILGLLLILTLNI